MKKIHTMPSVKLTLLAMGLLLMLSACGSKTSYRFLDWAVAWSIDDYVQWTSGQEKFFDVALDKTLDWHQSTQLPRYSAFFRRWADNVEAPMTVPNLQRDVELVNGFVRDIMREVSPAAADLLAQLDDQQVQEMLASIEEKQLSRSKKDQKKTAEERLEERIKRTQKTTKQFIGALSKPQKQLIRGWAETVGSNQSEWAQSRSSWMDGFQSALAVRAEPGFERAIEQLFVDADSFWSSDYQQRYAANTAHGIELVIALQQTLTAKQQKKLRRELLDWADNFSELAEEKQQLALAVP